MSSEVVKKRGRPKKVTAESSGADNSESAKKVTIRQKSTKAATPPADKPAKTSATKAKSSSATPKVVSKDAETASKPLIEAVSPSAPNATSNATLEAAQAPPQVAKTSNSAKITLTSSTILDQVRLLSSKTYPTPESSSTSSQIANAPLESSSRPSNRASRPSAPNTMKTPSPPPAIPKPKTNTSGPAKPIKSVPIAALNSNIVSQISSRAGARPSSKSAGELPPNYKSTARKVTMTIVALPIAIVTSWILYERLVLGQDRKELVKPGMARVEEDPSKQE